MVNPIQVQKFLAGIDYPARRPDLIDRAREQGADDAVLRTLENIPDRDYDGPDSVSEAIGEQQP